MEHGEASIRAVWRTLNSNSGISRTLFHAHNIKHLALPEQLEQIDLRVGTILTVTNVPDSEKLVALDVSFGDHKRTVLVGMKRERANARESEGKQALFVVNLPPRKMAGMVSEGMLFDIGYSGRITPVLAIPETAVPDGTRAG
jgi:tRNA-binding protein